MVSNVSSDRKDNIIISLIDELSEAADKEYLNLALNNIFSDDELNAYGFNRTDDGTETHVTDERKDEIILDLVDELSEGADEEYLNLALNNIFTEEEMLAYNIDLPKAKEEEEIFIPRGR